MTEVPGAAGGAVVRLHGAIGPAAVTSEVGRLAAADEHGLGGAAPLDPRKLSIDELPIHEEAHAAILVGPRDT